MKTINIEEVKQKVELGLNLTTEEEYIYLERVLGYSAVDAYNTIKINKTYQDTFENDEY